MTPAGTHSFAWADPSPTWQAALTRSGLEIWQGVPPAKLPRPPIAAAMDFSIPEVQEGRVVFAADAAPRTQIRSGASTAGRSPRCWTARSGAPSTPRFRSA